MSDDAPAEVPPTPAPLLAPPTEQPPLPGVAFGEHGNPIDVTRPKGKRGIYVDKDGIESEVQIVAERKDGSVDILIGGDVCGHRRDGVLRKMTDDQVGDFIK